MSQTKPLELVLNELRIQQQMLGELVRESEILSSAERRRVTGYSTGPVSPIPRCDQNGSASSPVSQQRKPAPRITRLEAPADFPERVKRPPPAVLALADALSTSSWSSAGLEDISDEEAEVGRTSPRRMAPSPPPMVHRDAYLDAALAMIHDEMGGRHHILIEEAIDFSGIKNTWTSVFYTDISPQRL